MKNLKIITFWIGVNIIGLPERISHVIEERYNKYSGKTELVVKTV
jgi:hypothetical protein